MIFKSILSLLFFLLVTPVALVQKLFRRDELGLKYDRQSKSYARTSRKRNFNHFRKQF